MKVSIAGLFLTISACAHGLGPATDQAGTQATDNPVRLVVTNYSGGPMEIHAVGSGMTYRIGMVQPGLVGHFVLRRAMTVGGPVEFLARANNRERPFRSDRLLLAPGATVDLQLAIHTGGSTATVRR
jgi:hypothetical protein